MKYLYFFLMILTATLHASDPHERDIHPSESLAGFSGPSPLVNDCVCTITGEFVYSQTDFILAGPKPLQLTRTYSSNNDSYSKLSRSWQWNHFNKISISRACGMHEGSHGHWYDASIEDPSGAKLVYSKVSLGTSPHSQEHLDFKKPKGFTNLSDQSISARTNLKNQNFHFLQDDQQCHIYTPDSSLRVFEQTNSFQCDCPEAHTFLEFIQKSERSISGHQFNYDFKNPQKDLINVRSIFAPIQYSWLQIDYSNYCAKQPTISVTTSDGRKAIYQFKNFPSKGGKTRTYLTHVTTPDQPWEDYQYSHKHDKDYSHLCKIERPGERYLKIDYYSTADKEIEKDDWRMGRVKSLKMPAGPDGEEVSSYRFIYHKQIDGNGVLRYYTTDVLDSENNKIVYHYSLEHRLTSIEKYKGKNPYCRTGYVWGQKNSVNDGNLMGSYLQNAQNNRIHSARFFEYDTHGNILVENLYGDLSGINESQLTIKDGKPVGGESYKRTLEYSKDEWHLLLSESEDNGKTVLYGYKPGTDLLQSKLILFKNQVKERHFFEYNETSVIVKIIHDDGTSPDKNNLIGVTERKITKIQPYMTAPVGAPEHIEEFYFDLKTGKEVLLKRIWAAYSLTGHLLKQDHYDANGVYRYTLTWDYDDHGNVIQEVNALGHTITRRYDENDNLIFEQGPSPDYHTNYVYDRMNRLIKAEEVHSDGNQFITSYRYDTRGNRISAADRFGQETEFKYNELGQVTSIIGPQIPNENGVLVRPETVKEYDVAGNVKFIKDAKGNFTKTNYNARGKPIQIEHPDGTLENFVYNLDGTLEKATAPNGTFTCYSYDYLGRVTKHEIYSADQQLLSRTTSEYHSRHLKSTTDAEGFTTYYLYDGAGRLISTKLEDRETRLTYDSLGRVGTSTIYYNEQNSVVYQYQYDLLDRITEERVEDNQGQLLRHICYSYDIQGNRTHVISDTQAGFSLDRTEYNSQNLPIKNIDALGNTTITTYDFHFINTYGQNVLQTTTTDPLGNMLIKTYDTANRECSLVRQNPFGVVLAQQEIFYDILGNRSRILDTVLFNGMTQRQITTIWEYNVVNQITRQGEATGTPEQKDTRYTYNDYGQKASLLKPDGVQISYTYDPQGRLETYFASDNSFSYIYSYDRKGQPIKITDQNGNSTERSYNAFGNILKETLGNNSILEYTYDHLGRQTSVNLPDQSGIQYVYDAANLKEIRRTENGDTTYTHYYTGHDNSGSITSVQLPSQAGTVKFTHDLLRRPIQIETPTWNQESAKYDPAGNLITLNIQDNIGVLHNEYTYDDLYQLHSEKGVSPHTYACDSLNNRLVKDEQPYTINSLNQILKQTNCKYTYDRNGNLQEKLQGNHLTQYMYDALDRLIAIVDGGEQTTFTYDAFNRRLTKTAQGTTTKYLYVDQDEIGAMVNNTIIELRILGTGKGAEIGAAVALELNKELVIPLHDYHGNIITLLDSSGKTVETYRYTAFGEEQIYDSTGQRIETSFNPWRFCSKRFDTESGFIFFGRRYYSPEIGRWITPDPIGFDDGPNLYAFLHHNPLTRVDFYGLSDRDSNRGSSDAYTQRAHELEGLRDNGGSRNVERNFRERSQDKATSAPGIQSWQNVSIHDNLDEETFERGLVEHHGDYARGLVLGGGILATGAAITYIGGTVALEMAVTRTLSMGREAAGVISRGFNCLKDIFRPPPKPTLGNSLPKTPEGFQLNRFHDAASKLSEIGQNNIRTLRGWARSKGWEPAPNPNGGPERWGILKNGEFEWRLKIKPESSWRPNLDSGSTIPRFEARLKPGGNGYINPLTGKIGGKEIGGHVPLEYSYY